MSTALQILQIDHCSVIIADVERSRRFYRDVLGLTEIHKPRTFDFVVVWFDLGNQHLHLLLKDEPDTLSPRHFARLFHGDSRNDDPRKPNWGWQFYSILPVNATSNSAAASLRRGERRECAATAQIQADFIHSESRQGQ